MANPSVKEIASLINQQVESQENIQELLLKTEAIANVALSEDFLDYKEAIIHAYISVLCDMINKIKELQEQALNDLIKHML